MDYPPKKAYVIGMVQGIPGFVASFYMFFFFSSVLVWQLLNIHVLYYCVVLLQWAHET